MARVLSSPRLKGYQVDDSQVAEILAFLAPFIPSVEFDVHVRDASDAPVIRSALAGQAEAIVTGDRDLLDDGELRRSLAQRGIRILTPRELLSLIQGVSEDRGRYVTRRGRYRVAAPRERIPRAGARTRAAR